MKKTIIISIVTAVVFGVGFFFVGYSYGKNSLPTNIGKNVMGQNSQRLGGNFNGQTRGVNTQNAINGEVISKDEKSITIKLKDGGSAIAFIGSGTTIYNTSTSTIESVSVGKQIFISGTKNQDGSFSTQSIQIRGEFGPNLSPIK